MSEPEFDVIVVGAGLAGLCCAGELVLQGANPLLISETKEVGAVFRPKWVGENRGFVQHPISVVSWGGGWWYSLARRLNVPIRMYPAMGFEIAIHGSPDIHEVPICVSAAAMTDFLIKAAPFPIEEIRSDFEKVIDAALNLPYQELLAMDRVPMGEWLADQKVSEFAEHVVLMLGCVTAGSTIEETREHTSVLGVFGYLRAILCGEGTFPVVYPDARDGLCVPIAKTIENRGGTVWRGRKVERVLTEGDRVRGVLMADGTEVNAPMVAIATGNPRIRALLDPLPPEAVEPLAFSEQHAYQDYCTYAVLDKPVVPPERKNWLSILEPTGSFIQVTWPLHTCAPWSTEPGKQFVLTQAVGPKTHYDSAGVDEAAVYAKIHEVNESFFPGYKDAMVDCGTDRHGHFWFSESGTGPKLERVVKSVDGLFFVGDGTVPIVGVAADAAAGAGVMGARAIAAKRKG